MTRNYAAEMRERIDSWQDGSDDPARHLAATLFKDLTETDPDLLAGWMKALALSHLAGAFHDRRGSARRQARARAGSLMARFSSVIIDPDASRADKAEIAAEMERLTTFSVKMVVNESGETRSVGQMTAADNLFVARRYGRNSKRDALLAVFYQKVAEKVGDRTVEDVFDVAAYVELWASLTSATVVPA